MCIYALCQISAIFRVRQFFRINPGRSGADKAIETPLQSLLQLRIRSESDGCDRRDDYILLMTIMTIYGLYFGEEGKNEI